ncbi:uncharacterized protein LOC130569457 isoform X2 [Triplophysa rosa]|uniref:uncharacterized protein LOC130569457 isoform X2 n=1 Tax=Triplophysa rosa TaxID=992332 RepID=UPI002545DFFD|nr:uncharacterized protein LOC130569457 isoform X2 [Triplophysa rosa]
MSHCAEILVILKQTEVFATLTCDLWFYFVALNVWSRIMGAVGVVLLVGTFTAACKADDLFNITCRNVTGRVGKESTLNCEVSYPDKTCCMMMFEYMNTPDTTIYREEFRKDPCLQFTSFPCPYTANEVMTTTFKFILQTRCENKTAEFTVNIAAVKEDDAGGPKGDPTKETPVQTDETWIVVIIAAIICCVVFVVGFLLMKPQCKNTCGFRCVCDKNISNRNSVTAAEHQSTVFMF